MVAWMAASKVDYSAVPTAERLVVQTAVLLVGLKADELVAQMVD